MISGWLVQCGSIRKPSWFRVVGPRCVRLLRWKESRWNIDRGGSTPPHFHPFPANDPPRLEAIWKRLWESLAFSSIRHERCRKSRLDPIFKRFSVGKVSLTTEIILKNKKIKNLKKKKKIFEMLQRDASSSLIQRWIKSQDARPIVRDPLGSFGILSGIVEEFSGCVTKWPKSKEAVAGCFLCGRRQHPSATCGRTQINEELNTKEKKPLPPA